MIKNHELSNLLALYLDGPSGLDGVREFVSFYVGEVDDQLINQVSLEIWHFEDGLIDERELRQRLAVFLDEFGHPSSNFYGFGRIPEMTGTTGVSLTGRYDCEWSIHDNATIIRGTHQFV
jgi:hypothetical protein